MAAPGSRSALACDGIADARVSRATYRATTAGIRSTTVPTVATSPFAGTHRATVPQRDHTVTGEAASRNVTT